MPAQVLETAAGGAIPLPLKRSAALCQSSMPVTLQGHLLGVVEWQHGQVLALKSDPVMWSDDLRMLLTLCNDLTPAAKGKITGPEDEVKMFKQMEAAFLVTRSG